MPVPKLHLLLSIHVPAVLSTYSLAHLCRQNFEPWSVFVLTPQVKMRYVMLLRVLENVSASSHRQLPLLFYIA